MDLNCMANGCRWTVSQVLIVTSVYPFRIHIVLLYCCILYIYTSSPEVFATSWNHSNEGRDSQGIAKGLARRIAGGLIIGILLQSSGITYI